MKRLVTTLTLLLLISGCGSTPKSTEAEAKPKPVAPVWQDVLYYKITNYSVSNAECDYSEGSLEFIVNFKNLSSKKIIAISASATITDVFDEEIKSLNISSDEAIEAGETIKAGSTGNSCWSLNRYDADDTRLKSMDLKTTRVTIDVSKIAYADGEVVEY